MPELDGFPGTAGSEGRSRTLAQSPFPLRAETLGMWAKNWIKTVNSHDYAASSPLPPPSVRLIWVAADQCALLALLVQKRSEDRIAGCSRVLLGLKPSSIWHPHWTTSWSRFGSGVCRTALNSRRWSVYTATTPCWMIWVCRLSLGDRWGADNKPRELVLITSLATRGGYAEQKWPEKLTIIRNNTKCLLGNILTTTP